MQPAIATLPEKALAEAITYYVGVGAGDIDARLGTLRDVVQARVSQGTWNGQVGSLQDAVRFLGETLQPRGASSESTTAIGGAMAK